MGAWCPASLIPTTCMDPTLILVTDSENLKTRHWCYSRDIVSYFLVNKKSFVFMFYSLRYLLSYYSAIRRQEELVKEKNTCPIISVNSSFLREIFEFYFRYYSDLSWNHCPTQMDCDSMILCKSGKNLW